MSLTTTFHMVLTIEFKMGGFGTETRVLAAVVVEDIIFISLVMFVSIPDELAFVLAAASIMGSYAIQYIIVILILLVDGAIVTVNKRTNGGFLLGCMQSCHRKTGCAAITGRVTTCGRQS